MQPMWLSLDAGSAATLNSPPLVPSPMKNAFLLGIILVVPVAVTVALLYSLGRFLWSLYTDARLYRELDQIQSQSEARRETKRLENVKRLDNGCEHSFDSALGGFPPGVCPKCGLGQSRPPGPCDHVWRRKEGPAMASYCQKCGKEYHSEI